MYRKINIMKIVRLLYYAANVVAVLFVSTNLIAQGNPPAPPGNPTIPIPWGTPIIYLLSLALYGIIRFKRRSGKRYNKMPE